MISATDGEITIFPTNHILPRPEIELMSEMLNLLEGPLSGRFVS